MVGSVRWVIKVPELHSALSPEHSLVISLERLIRDTKKVRSRNAKCNTKELKFESQDGKTSPCKTHNVSLQETEDLTPGATKIVGKKVLA